jgi:hypothetical protein
LLSFTALSLAVACSKAPLSVITLRPAEMQPTGKFTVAADGGVSFWGNGEIKSELSAAKGPIAIEVRGFGNTVEGEAPQILFELAGRVVGRIDVNSQDLRAYTITATVRESGEHLLLRLVFVNHRAGPTLLEGRNLCIRSVSVTQPG